MKLRSSRDTNVPPVYAPVVKRKSAQRAAQSISKMSGRKRRNRLPSEASSRKRSKVEELETANIPTTSAAGIPVKAKEIHKKRYQDRQMITQRNPIRVRNISELPCHVLVKIFELLPIIERVKAERVCRLWNYLGRQYSWTQTNTFSYPTLIQQTECTSYRCINERPVLGNAEVKSLMQRCGKYITNLDLHAFRDCLTYAVCSSFATLCPQLRTLNLYGIQLTNSSLQLLGRHCPSLQSVNFYRCFQESVVERGLSSFFNKCKALRSVDIGGNERLTGVPSFSMLPDTVRSLKINGCYRLTAESMGYVRTRCPELTTLIMSSVDSLSATELNNFFGALQNLQKLKFGECFISHTIGGADLNLSSLKNLTELTVNDNLLVTDRVLRTIVNGCKQLKFVDVSGCNRFLTHNGLLELAKLPVLAYLNLSMLRVTSDTVVKKIAEKGLLKVLLMHRCDEVTDAGISEVLQHCKNLTCLDVSFCPKVTDASMKEMHKFVVEREQKEAAKPPPPSNSTKSYHDGLVAEMLRLERSLHGLMDVDIERNLPRVGEMRYQLTPAPGSQCSKNKKEVVENTEGFTELHVWIGHSGIAHAGRVKHRLLKIDDTNANADHTPSIFEFRLVIRIN